MAHDTSTLKAQKRDQSGKGPARRLRAKGLVPAVCYGPFGAPLHVALDPEAIMVAIATPHKFNTVINLEVEGGEKRTVLFKSHERDPVDHDVLAAIQVEVPEPRVLERDAADEYVLAVLDEDESRPLERVWPREAAPEAALFYCGDEPLPALDEHATLDPGGPSGRFVRGTPLGRAPACVRFEPDAKLLGRLPDQIARLGQCFDRRRLLDRVADLRYGELRCVAIGFLLALLEPGHRDRID